MKLTGSLTHSTEIQIVKTHWTCLYPNKYQMHLSGFESRVCSLNRKELVFPIEISMLELNDST